MSEEIEKPTNCRKKIVRDADGLIEGINYIYDSNGLIDWRRMVNPKYLVPNKTKTQETDISKLGDNDLLILLAGIKDLAQVRGFNHVYYDISTANTEYVAVKCHIEFIGNYETENREISFESVADAHYSNTNGIGKTFLATVAENRSFARCVRNFLRINIVSEEEAAETKKEEKPVSPTEPIAFLKTLMKENSIDFEKLKSMMINQKIDGADKFEKLKDIPKPIVFNLIEKIKSLNTTTNPVPE